MTSRWLKGEGRGSSASEQFDGIDSCASVDMSEYSFELESKLVRRQLPKFASIILLIVLFCELVLDSQSRLWAGSLRQSSSSSQDRARVKRRHVKLAAKVLSNPNKKLVSFAANLIYQPSNGLSHKPPPGIDF